MSSDYDISIRNNFPNTNRVHQNDFIQTIIQNARNGRDRELKSNPIIVKPAERPPFIYLPNNPFSYSRLAFKALYGREKIDPKSICELCEELGVVSLDVQDFMGDVWRELEPDFESVYRVGKRINVKGIETLTTLGIISSTKRFWEGYLRTKK